MGIYDELTNNLSQPIITNYDPSGTDFLNTWNLKGAESDFLKNPLGTGHITVRFLTSTQLSIDFNFPQTTHDQIFTTQSLNIMNTTQDVLLFFGFPAYQNYSPGECYKFDNYRENGNTQNTTMSSTCDGKSAGGIMSNVGFQYSEPYLLTGLLSLGSIGSVVVIILKRKNNRLRALSAGKNDLDISLCPNCNKKVKKDDKYCESCGTPVTFS